MSVCLLARVNCLDNTRGEVNGKSSVLEEVKLNLGSDMILLAMKDVKYVSLWEYFAEIALVNLRTKYMFTMLTIDYYYTF